MKPAGITDSLWLGRDDRIPAEERLRGVVASLTRARRAQQMVDCAFIGLLAGLVAATLVVLTARLVPFSISLWPVVAAPLIAVLAVALWVGWRRRPDALAVAIRVDLRLGLRQRLSTAWEFMTDHRDDPRVERLAAQAVKADLPRSPGRIFPFRINRWGQLAPLAAAALLLASFIDLERTQALTPSALDEGVVSEGQRLSVYARAMQERALRDALPRSTQEAERLEGLGRRMQGGAYSRAESLEHLRAMERSLDDESRRALSEGSASGVRSSETPSVKPGAIGEPSSTGILERDSSALRAMDDAGRTVVPRSTDPAERQATNDPALRQLLENGSAAARANREYEELGRAREQVRQAQENLGEALAHPEADRPSADAPRAGDGEDDEGWDASRHRGLGSAASRSSGRSDVPAPTGPESPASRNPSSQYGPVLKPQGQMREGESFVSHAQVASRPVQPRAEEVPLSREFAPQVEEVMSKEHYPARYKRFVRQYFLTLSQGAPNGESQSKEQQ
jgi:hypothetical protein